MVHGLQQIEGLLVGGIQCQYLQKSLESHKVWYLVKLSRCTAKASEHYKIKDFNAS